MAKKAASAKNPVKKTAKNPVKKTGAESTPKKKSAPSQLAKAVDLTAAKAEHALSVSERAKIKKLLRTKTRMANGHDLLGVDPIAKRV